MACDRIRFKAKVNDEFGFGRKLPYKVLYFLRRYGSFILIGIFLLMRVFDFYPSYELAVLLIDQLGNLIVAIV